MHNTLIVKVQILKGFLRKNVKHKMPKYSQCVCVWGIILSPKDLFSCFHGLHETIKKWLLT